VSGTPEPAEDCCLFDTHAHLHDPAFEPDRDAVLARARAAGVRRVLTVGTDPVTSRQALTLAERHPDVYAAVGIHPHDAAGADPDALAMIATLARAPRVVAIGEIGLDSFRTLSPPDAQRVALRAQLALARELGKPVLLHCRDAHAELLDVLAADGLGGASGVMHCFSGDVAVAERCLAVGLVISLAGPVTYPNARRLAEVARRVPLERLVIETDCPYLPPQPWRGRRNEPAHLLATATRVAELRGLQPTTVARQLTETACARLGVPRPW